MNTKGKSPALTVAIEGIDGAGKHTQAELLQSAAQRLGFRAEILSFPRYNQTFFAQSIAAYLNGEYGPLASVDPRLPALLYAGDRFESLPTLLKLCQTNDIVILDRYVASNYAYQAARIDPSHRAGFISWLAHIEHQVFGLPEADVTVYLDMPVDLAVELVRRKRPRTYTMEAADIHERDRQYLATCREVYATLANSGFHSSWVSIPCALPGGRVQDAQEVHELIMQALGRDLESLAEQKIAAHATVDAPLRGARHLSSAIPHGDR